MDTPSPQAARHQRWHFPRCIEVLPGRYELEVHYFVRRTENSLEVYELLRRLAHDGGLSILVVTHDVALAQRTDRVVRLASHVHRLIPVRIPEDVAMVGFDGLPRGPELEPTLTTIVQPVVEVGRNAVGLLAGDQTQPQVVMLPTALRLGESCGAADLHDPVPGR